MPFLPPNQQRQSTNNNRRIFIVPYSRNLEALWPGSVLVSRRRESLGKRNVFRLDLKSATESLLRSVWCMSVQFSSSADGLLVTQTIVCTIVSLSRRVFCVTAVLPVSTKRERVQHPMLPMLFLHESESYGVLTVTPNRDEEIIHWPHSPWNHHPILERRYASPLMSVVRCLCQGYRKKTWWSLDQPYHGFLG